jgi:Reverse transcriptase (RNA-dependent DNA polymerase)
MKLDNGTPQGSVISPLLFIIMTNDFPTIGDPSVNTSLYADDSAIWKTSNNLKYLFESMQNTLKTIVKWGKAWGFKINSSKTCSIVFTSRRIPVDLNLKINKTPIRNVKETKFLAVYFDSKLTWQKHIDYIITKAKRHVNLLRMLKGKSWGASKKNMLLIYKSLIRSKLDYGAELLYTASKSQLKKLETLQYTCLKICTGALRSTSLLALQNKCGDPPMEVQRFRALLRHIARIKTTDSNPAKECLTDSWQNYYGHYHENKPPVFKLFEPIRKIF